MPRKWFLLLHGLGILSLAFGLVLWIQSPVRAQCGDNPQKSSCITCHTKEDPVELEGEWHAIHARKDCCTNCHGGNCVAIDKDLAHENLVENPLTDIYTGCHSCHPDDYAARAARFAVILAVTPGSISTPTAVPTSQVVEHPMVILSPSAPATSFQPWLLMLDGFVLCGLILLVVIVLIYYLHIHHQSFS
jgi:hypothetical protein